MNRPLRILHLTAGSDAGGVSRYIFDLSSALYAQGHQVTIAGQRGEWHWLFDNAPFKWLALPLKGGPWPLWRSMLFLKRYCEQNQIDLLHTHYRKPTLVARRLQHFRRMPVLYSVHLSHITIAGPRRWFSDFGDHTHVASEDARRWLLQEARVPQQRVSLIPHGIDAEKFPFADDTARSAARAELGLSPTDLVAVYVGRLDSPKNEKWVLDVAARSRVRLPNLKVLLAGDGPHEAALRQRILDEHLGDRVRCLGHRDALAVYQAADALLLPSQREGFSLVCAEAMSVGTPVLRTRTSGTSELIVEGVTGASVPINREAFIERAIAFLSDAPALARMRPLASHHIRQHFAFSRQVDQTIELYRRLIEMKERYSPWRDRFIYD